MNFLNLRTILIFFYIADLGLDNETNNNQLIEKPFQFDLNHQATSTPSTLANRIYFPTKVIQMIKILQEQLCIFNSEKASFDASQQKKSRASRSAADETGPAASTFTATTTDVESLVKEMVNLKITCCCLQNENEKLHESNRALSTTKAVFEEMLESRDRTLVSQTREVYDLESKNSRMATRAELEREYLADEMPRLELKEKRLAAKLYDVKAKCSQITAQGAKRLHSGEREKCVPSYFFGFFYLISGRGSPPEHFGASRIPKFQVVHEIWPIKDKRKFSGTFRRKQNLKIPSSF
ncbi:hypothetical protein TYRP_002533 [Tyrophagus putrescentiae]|nr:hypothetical protein TYRP_002533 [Tyrophagus putrescentiae]